MKWIDRMLTCWSTGNGSEKGEGQKLVDARLMEKGELVRVRTVWFDPWKYQDRDDVLRGIIAEIIRETIKVQNSDLATVTNAVRLFGGMLGKTFLAGLESVKIKAGLDGAGVEVEPDKVVRGAIEAFKEANHPERSFANDLEQTLSDWVRYTIPKDKRLVVFIDDLDRCQPSVAIEVLEALKLYLRIPRTIFVVGVDRPVITALVESLYDKQGVREVDAHRYLAKMFQVEVTLDAEEDLTEMCFDTATEGHEIWNDLDNRAQDMIREYALENANRNPRDVKRLFNGIIMGAAGQLHHDRAFTDEGDNAGQSARSLLRGAQRVMIRHRIEVMLGKELEGSDTRDRLAHCLESIGKHDWDEFRDWYASVLSWNGTPGTLPARPKDIADYEFLLEDGWVERILGKRDPAAWRQAILDGESENLRIIRSCVANQAKKRPNELTDQDLRRCNILLAEQSGVSHLPPILALPQLRELDIAVNDIQVTGELEQLQHLRKLDVQETGVMLSVLTGLVKLELLNIARNGISDLSPIAGLTQLEFLRASNNDFSDLRPLSGMVKLKHLDLEHTPVVDLSPIESLSELEFLAINHTGVRQLDVLLELPKLREVHLDGIPASHEDVARLRQHLQDGRVSGTPRQESE